MKPQTTAILYNVQDKLNECRKTLDDYMYGGEKALETEDSIYCRRVYARICKVLDLL